MHRLRNLLKIAALFIALGAAYPFIDSYPDDRWVTTQGTLTSSEWAGILSPAPNMFHIGGGGSIRRWRVCYIYMVEGAKYAGCSTTSEDFSDDQITVYYHPLRPDLSGLELGPDILSSVFAGAIAFTLFMASFLVPQRRLTSG